MVADALFTILNIDRVESVLHRIFPNLDVRKVAIVEGVTGCIVIFIKISTKTIV